MPWPYHFHRIPVRLLDPKIYGRVVRGYEHPSGVRLVHHKLRSRQAAAYRMFGVWMLCDGDRLIARKAYYGREMKVGPLQWAATELRKHLSAKLCGTPTPDPA